MATTPQQFIQPTAQANTPFLANNGNPNTVYNSPATVFGDQSASPWRNIRPMGGTNIQPHWSFAPASTALPASSFADPSRQFWRTNTALAPAQFTLDNSGAMGDTNPFVPPPVAEPPPPVDVIDPWTPPTNVTPTDNGLGGNADNLIPGTITHDVVTDIFRTPPGNPANIHLGWNSNGQGSMSVGDRTVPINGLSSITDGLQNLASRIGQGFGYSNGRLDGAQLIDALSEIVLPGDLYNANIGSWNSMNVVRSLLNAVIPGLGNAGQWLASLLPEGNPISEWVRTMQQQNVDDALVPADIAIRDMMDSRYQEWSNSLNPFNNVNVPLPGRYTPTGTVTASGLDSTGTWTTGQTPEEIEAGYNDAAGAANPGVRYGFGSTPFDSRSGMSAGSRVIAEGQDAQNWVASMQQGVAGMYNPTAKQNSGRYRVEQ